MATATTDIYTDGHTLSLHGSLPIEQWNRAMELHGAELVNEHIKSASRNGKDLDAVLQEMFSGGVTPESRPILGKAARTKKAGWFKSVMWMEDVGRELVGPNLANADAGFRALVDRLFGWASTGGECNRRFRD